MKDRLIFSLKVVKKLIQNWGLNRISVDCNNRVIKVHNGEAVDESRYR